MTNPDYFELLKTFPRLEYPFPRVPSPILERLREDARQWLETDLSFLSETTREKYERHKLTDIGGLGFPYMNTYEEALAPARYTVWGALIDDYYDHCDFAEMNKVRVRMVEILNGDRPGREDNGFFRQIAATREELLSFGMPPKWYDRMVKSLNDYIRGMQDEKYYIANQKFPPLAYFLSVREQTGGALPYCQFACLQKNYRELPDDFLEHPYVLRLHSLASRMIPWHNDFVSLPKELSRDGDVFNLILVIQQEYNLSLEEAYREALRFHDADLAEFLTLQAHLPFFGEYQDLANDYVTSLGVMVQGIYTWHVVDNGRYVPGAYNEPEFGVVS